jgi:hypothetical protein
MNIDRTFIDLMADPAFKKQEQEAEAEAKQRHREKLIRRGGHDFDEENQDESDEKS